MEIWKDVKGYEGLYQISNYGFLKSLPREIKGRNNYYYSKERMLTPNKGYGGYIFLTMCVDEKRKTVSAHRLVSEHFLKKEKDKNIVNHIDGDKTNNFVGNLEWCNNRENSSHYTKSTNKYSQYIGVSFDKRRNKFCAKIKIKGKTINLGRFETELESYQARVNFEKENGIINKYL